MTSLLDLGPMTEEVTIRGKTIVCYGVTAGGLFYLISNYPEIRMLLEQKASSLNLEDLLDKAQGAISAIISIGTTDPEEYISNSKPWKEAVKKGIKAANTLGVSDQLTVISAVFKLTFPDGTGPFVERINGMTAAFNSTPTMSPETTEPGTKLPAPSSASFQTDKPGMTRGSVRRDN